MDDKSFSGRFQETIQPAETKTLQWSILFFEIATKVKNVEATRAYFIDGEDLKIE